MRAAPAAKAKKGVRSVRSFYMYAERLAAGLILAAFSAAPQAAAEAGKQKAVTVYARDVAFCRRLVRELDQVKVIEPILSSPKLWRIIDTRDTNDAQGEWYVDANRYYFIDVTLTNPEADLDRIIWQPDWRRQLFRPDRMTPPTKAQERLGMKLIYDPAGRWRALERRFPGFLLTKVRDLYGRVTQAPKWFALYHADFDGDGKKEHILHRQYNGPNGKNAYSNWQILDRFDPISGNKVRLIQETEYDAGAYTLRLMRYRSRIYLTGRTAFAVWFGAIAGEAPHRERSKSLCSFHDAKRLTDIRSRELVIKTHRN